MICCKAKTCLFIKRLRCIANDVLWSPFLVNLSIKLHWCLVEVSSNVPISWGYICKVVFVYYVTDTHTHFSCQSTICYNNCHLALIKVIFVCIKNTFSKSWSGHIYVCTIPLMVSPWKEWQFIKDSIIQYYVLIFYTQSSIVA